jgi:hypothetical protein
MLRLHQSSFHPDRGIGQGDTPSTLIFIAVFDILLTLLDSSSTGEPHAYADDLGHLAKTLIAQQRQADLVCGFAAYTGIEISVPKVEAISIFNGRIMYDTPFLTLRDWKWTPHRIQHKDDGFWTRYLGLYLDTNSCQQHFEAAAAQLSKLCHVLKRKHAPPDAKRLVYTLSIKSQVRYPAGLAPWNLHQYHTLDRTPTSLLRQIYGLRSTFPTALIYTPISMGGCGEERISDSAQLQKWTYLQSVAHLVAHSSQVVTELIQRAVNNTITEPTRYCTSLLEWGKLRGLTLSRMHATTIPASVMAFIEAAPGTSPVTIYSDGSFEQVDVPLRDALATTRTDQTSTYGRGATGIYTPSNGSRPALALKLVTPVGRATDAFYQELLGIALGALMSQHMPIEAYSDCEAAIKRFRHTSNPLGSSIGHLQYGPLLQGIKKMRDHLKGHTLSWTKHHPERYKLLCDWTDQDHGIYMADLVAGDHSKLEREKIHTYTADAEELHMALIPEHTWVWKLGSNVLTESLRSISHKYRFQ